MIGIALQPGQAVDAGDHEAFVGGAEVLRRPRVVGQLHADALGDGGCVPAVAGDHGQGLLAARGPGG